MSPLYARHKRTTLAIATAVAAGALLATGVTTSATAQPAAKPLAAAPTQLSAAARTTLIQQAQAGAADTAQRIGLGAKEKLVVKDVVKDVDGTLHTRYERTYAGLPVLGGDLIVHTAKSGKTEGVTKAAKSAIKVSSLKPQITAAKAEKQAVSAAKTLGSAKTTADGARKVIWAGSGKPVLAYETVVGGLQDDGTPNQLHVITDAATGKKLYEYQGIENATGKTLYSGTVTLNSVQSGSTYQLTDSARGNHKTYNLARKTSGTGTLVASSTNVFGTGTASTSSSDQTAAADAAYGAAETWDFYKSTFGRSGIKNNGVGAYSRVHYGNAYVNAFWDDSCFCMTYGDGSGNGTPLRYMDKPSKDGGSSDYWSSSVGTKDVHYSSGVANHFFYLLSEGSGSKTINGVTYNSPTYNGSTVTGIGRAKALQIWYKALTTYMTSTTNYKAARTATLNAASALYGSTSTEYKAVAAAWSAVNVA
ncbi:M4 family metallopeptidase [Streptomyces sp. NRRL S-1022]|uniref:M4 family metallopeptidase n=1 Tax=Streptomyces sp. NRRL S-1022 TaxID=1463880 RepID=UPI0004C0730E|nr:M4 family metallopeptidase [Streptomyces sp. NRRL S-1022]